MADVDLFAPLSSLQWVDRDALRPNDYNPNKVNRENLKLLVQSIMTNGWTLPIVVRPDYTIIDGFHRWTVAGEEPLHTKLGGKVPVVVVRHEDASECQRQFEIVRKRRRNFVVFRRGGKKTKRFLAQKECSRFAVSDA